MKTTTGTSLPVLQGLLQRPGASERFVNDVLKRQAAGIKIARWVAAMHRKDAKLSGTAGKSHNAIGAIEGDGGTKRTNRKRRKLRQEATPDTNVVVNIGGAGAMGSQFPSLRSGAEKDPSEQHHWLLQSILSPSLQVRQTATMLLLDHFEPNRIYKAGLLQNVVRGMINGSPCGPWDLQLFALLQHIHNPDLVSGPLLRWMAASVVKLLLAGSVQQSELRHASKHPPARLLLWMDFCTRVVLEMGVSSHKHTARNTNKPGGNHPIRASKRWHTLFWSGTVPAITVVDVPLSPLACWILVHAHLSEHPTSKATEYGIRSLSRLVHPGTVLKDRPVDDAETEKSESNPRQRGDTEGGANGNNDQKAENRVGRNNSGSNDNFDRLLIRTNRSQSTGSTTGNTSRSTALAEAISAIERESRQMDNNRAMLNAGDDSLDEMDIDDDGVGGDNFGVHGLEEEHDDEDDDGNGDDDDDHDDINHKDPEIIDLNETVDHLEDGHDGDRRHQGPTDKSRLSSGGTNPGGAGAGPTRNPGRPRSPLPLQPNTSNTDTSDGMRLDRQAQEENNHNRNNEDDDDDDADENENTDDVHDVEDMDHDDDEDHDDDDEDDIHDDIDVHDDIDELDHNHNRHRDTNDDDDDDDDNDEDDDDDDNDDDDDDDDNDDMDEEEVDDYVIDNDEELDSVLADEAEETGRSGTNGRSGGTANRGGNEIEDVVRQFEARLFDLTGPSTNASSSESRPSTGQQTSPIQEAPDNHRKRSFIDASMQVLSAVNALHFHQMPSAKATTPAMPVPTQSATGSTSISLLLPKSEQLLMKSICNIVKPPKKPLNLKVFMRRAQTQEEFFRGSLSRNPIPLSSLKPAVGSGPPSEPTIRDLRQHIAKDLQMSESAELLELLVANKIVGMDLKIRVVQQTLWKTHVLENSTAVFPSSLLSGQQGSSIFATRSGLSMVFSSSSTGERGSGSGSGSGNRPSLSSDTPVSALPPMVVTYRLAGVDGEATEDMVETLEDPEAPASLSSASVEERERLVEKEYGITRIVTNGKGPQVVLRSIQRHIRDIIRRIRRDDVAFRKTGRGKRSEKNPSLCKFQRSPPCSGITLLRHCSKLSSNRKKLVEARAPTILLRLLLDVLNAIDDSTTETPGADSQTTVVSNPTANALEELIETLASEISSEHHDLPTDTDTLVAGETAVDNQVDADNTQGPATLPLLLSSLRSIYLSPPLRKVIAKLLPYLTYGQHSLSKELAETFKHQIDVTALGECEVSVEQHNRTRESILMDTFVQAVINLPPSDVCSPLRTELVSCGFVDGLLDFVLVGIPSEPPPWSAALWPKNALKEKKDKAELERLWRLYFQRPGFKVTLEMLIGLSKTHDEVQTRFVTFAKSDSVSILDACHWIENTSDNKTAHISLDGCGLLAETLLDELAEEKDSTPAKTIIALRKKTRERKKEIADERRSKALVSMSAFGPLATAVQAQIPPSSSAGAAGGPATAGAGDSRTETANESSPGPSRDGETGAASSNSSSALFEPVLDFLLANSTLDNPSNARSGAVGGTASNNNNRSDTTSSPAVSTTADNKSIPAWMTEMEALEDESGLTCAICQEGRTLQPSELLGLYAYVKKVSVAGNKCGSRAGIEGTTLLMSLPPSLPSSLLGTHVDDSWFRPAKAAGNSLRSSRGSSSSLSQSASNRRMTHFVTTVSAGNAIHCSCHNRARSADKSHPKAPKSEWEGASLRNSRVSCNVILPLVSSKSSKVPLMAVDLALTDYQTVISNLLGARPKSMLWEVLHDARLLMLRMAYGEGLSADCGGGSLASNMSLLFYQLSLADMFTKDADHDSPETAKHSRALGGGFLAAIHLLEADDYRGGDSASNTLWRAVADAAPMAAMTSILYNNASADGENKSDQNSGEHDDGTETDTAEEPHPKRRWALNKDSFLRGLIVCAGRRHVLGADDSGCISSRNRHLGKRARASSFAEWDSSETANNADPATDTNSSSSTTTTTTTTSGAGGAATATSPTTKSPNRRASQQIEGFAKILRPIVTLYAMLDKLASVFVPNMSDEAVEQGAAEIVDMTTACHRATNIANLLEIAGVSLDHDKIVKDLKKGMVSDNLPW